MLADLSGFQKVQHRKTVVIIYTGEMNTHVHTKAYTRIFTAALLIIMESWKVPIVLQQVSI